MAWREQWIVLYKKAALLGIQHESYTAHSPKRGDRPGWYEVEEEEEGGELVSISSALSDGHCWIIASLYGHHGEEKGR